MVLPPTIMYNGQNYTLYLDSTRNPFATVTQDSNSGQNKTVYGYCTPNCKSHISVLEDGTIVTLNNGKIDSYGSNILGYRPTMPSFIPKAPFSMPQTSFSMPKAPFSMPQTSFSMPKAPFSMPQTSFSMPQAPNMSVIKGNFSQGASRISGPMSSFFNRGRTGGRRQRTRKSRKSKKSKKSKKSRRHKK